MDGALQRKILGESMYALLALGAIIVGYHGGFQTIEGFLQGPRGEERESKGRPRVREREEETSKG